MTPSDPRSTEVGTLLTAWFEADAPSREPDGLVDAALARTARVRPLPVWRLPERWIPMQLAMRRSTVANAVPILVVLALLVALAVGLLLIGAGRPRPLPLPDGLAGNGRLVYVGAGNLLSSDPAGGDVRTLVDSDRVVGEPVWSHDGTRFAFKAYTDPASNRQASIIVADADGTHQVTIAADVWDASPPSWSRDDRNLLLAFSTDGVDLSERLYAAPVDGSTPPARLAHDPGFAAGASHSPDGTMIAFETGANDSQALYLARPDGSGAHKLTTGRYYDIGGNESGSLGFAWSPDGTRLLFAAGDDMAHDLYVADVTGATPDRPVAASALHEFGATFAPDGDHVAYLASRPYEHATLMIANADGSDAHPAVQDSNQAFVWFTPRWSPDARFVTATTGSPVSGFQAELWIIDVAARTIHGRIALPPFATPSDGAPGAADAVGFQRVAP
jgi:Tol biopolymer transport system component